MAAFDAVGITATDLGRTLDFYGCVGLEISPTDESHLEVELDGGFRLMFDAVHVVETFSTYEPR